MIFLRQRDLPAAGTRAGSSCTWYHIRPLPQEDPNIAAIFLRQ
jgi:hypothetical protein